MAQLLKKLADFGNALTHSLVSNKELLALLKNFEAVLASIDQKPKDEVLVSLAPAAMTLITDQFLRHADPDLQIQVVCCITELLRITAPGWPYGDEMMKEFFLVFVESLGKLSTMNERCYAKFISMLYAVARFRPCLIMVELKMEGSIIEMFGHFVTTIQSRPFDLVFSDMVIIMTKIIESYFVNGNDTIPVDLLSVILNSLKKDKKEASPTSWTLAKKIFQELQQQCSKKGLFHFAEAVRSLVNDVNDYAKIVASICQNEPQKEVQVENMASKKRGRKRNSFYEKGHYFTGLAYEIACPKLSRGHKKNCLLSRKSNAASPGSQSFPDRKRSDKNASKKKASLPLQLVLEDSNRVETPNPTNTDDGLAPNTSSQLQLASGMTYAELLVGSKIKVWRPLEKRYSEGLVASFDLETATHKIRYDAVEETLCLLDEDWRLVKGPMSIDGPEAILCARRASSDLNRSQGGSSKQKKINNEGTSQSKRLMLTSE